MTSAETILAASAAGSEGRPKARAASPPAKAAWARHTPMKVRRMSTANTPATEQATPARAPAASAWRMKAWSSNERSMPPPNGLFLN